MTLIIPFSEQTHNRIQGWDFHFIIIHFYSDFKISSLNTCIMYLGDPILKGWQCDSVNISIMYAKYTYNNYAFSLYLLTIRKEFPWSFRHAVGKLCSGIGTT